MVRIDLLQKEIVAAINNSPSQGIGALVIIEQPNPQVVFKAKEVGTYKVELLTATRTHFEIMSKVNMVMSLKSDPKTKTDKIASLEETEQEMNNSIAVFETLKLDVSTRMLPSVLRFSVNLRERGRGGLALETPASYPLICITNESQWAEAVGKLLKEDVLDGKDSTTWINYANILQSHFLTTMSQDPQDPQCKLHKWEFSYIHAKWFAGNASASKEMVDGFWAWFGQVLLTIHFKRKILEMWREGVIFGFISKEESLEKLQKAEEGTFIIRFSESHPGAFAIACTTTDPKDKVKHFLVPPDDLTVNKTLADYLKERSQFKTILQVNPENRVVCEQPKDTVLYPFYSTRAKSKPMPTSYIVL